MINDTKKLQADLFESIDECFKVIEEINEKIEINEMFKDKEKLKDSK